MNDKIVGDIQKIYDLAESPLEKEIRRIARQEEMLSKAGLNPFKNSELDFIRSQVNALENVRKIVSPTIEVLEQFKTLDLIISQTQIGAFNNLANIVNPTFDVFEQLKEIGITINNQMTQFLNPINETINSLSHFSDQWQNLNSSLQFHQFAEISTSFLGVRNAILDNLSYTKKFSEALRTITGNWFDFPTLPKGYLDSLEIRKEFYNQIGVSQNLLEVDFPDTISLLNNSQLLRTSSLKKKETKKVSVVISIETNGGSYNKIAFTLITEFEKKLRNFIATKMLERFGPRWFITHVPNKVKVDAQTNQKGDQKNGTKIWEIEHYLEFSHYEQIILRKDNWDFVFSKFFPYQEYFRESLRRVNASRRTIMHSREIDPVQFTLLVFELNQLESILD